MANISEVTGRFIVACKKEDRQLAEEFVRDFNNITSKWYYNIIISDKYDDVDYSDFIADIYDVEYDNVDDYIAMEYDMVANGRWSFYSNIEWISCPNILDSEAKVYHKTSTDEDGTVSYNTVIDMNILDLYKRYAEKFSDKIFIKLDYVDFEPGNEIFDNGYAVISVSKNQYPVAILESYESDNMYITTAVSDELLSVLYDIDGIRLYNYILNYGKTFNATTFIELYNTITNDNKYEEVVNYIRSIKYDRDNTDVFEKYNILDKYDELLTKVDEVNN